MKKHSNKNPDSTLLRRKAEELLKSKQAQSSERVLSTDDLKLIHELDVRQVELEVQYEELLLSRSNVKQLTEKYAELYDSAPTSYFTISTKGEIKELNLSGAELLGKPRNNLKNSNLGFFITIETRPVFNQFLDNIFYRQTKEICEVTLLIEGHQPISAILTGIPDKNPKQCLLSVVDITELKRAEKALFDSEQKYRFMLESSEIGLGVYSLEGKILYYNQKALRALGGKADDYIGKTLYEIYGKEAASVFVERIRESAQSEKSIEYEEFVILKPGSRWFLSIYSRLIGPDGKIAGVQVIAHDITERKRAEETLRASVEFTKGLIDSMQDGISVLDTNGIHIDVNPAFCLMTGFSRKELLGTRPAHLYWPPEEYGRIEAAFQKTMAGETGSYELTFMHKNGERFPVILSPFAIKDKLGNTISYSATVKDISERKIAENQLRHSEQNLAEAERIGNTGSWEYNVASDTAVWSENMYRIFGVDPKMPKELVNRYFVKNLVHPDDHACVAAFFGDALAGKDPGNMEFRIIDSADKTRYIHTLAEVIRDADGNPLKMIGKVEDITERKLNEDALKERTIQLELAHRAAGAGTWDWDMKSGKLTWSKELFSLFGLDPEKDEATFDTWTQVVHPDDRAGASDRIENAVREKTHLNSEYRVVYADGEVHWISSLGNTIYNNAGEPERMTGICTDITERRQIEIQLQQSLYSLAEAERIGNTGSWEYNVASDTASWSENMFRIFDVDPLMPKELVFKYFLDNLVHPDDRANVEAVFLDALGGIRTYDLEYRILKSGNITRYIHALAEVIRDADGNPVKMIGKVEDISERKQAAELLRMSEEVFHNLFIHSPIGMYHSTLEGRFQTVNPALAAMLGFSGPDELIAGTTDLATQTYADPDIRKQIIGKLIKSDDWVEFNNVKWKRKDGSLITIEMTLRKVLSSEGSIAYIEGFAVDITKRKQAEETLNETNAYLENLVNYANAPIIVWDPQLLITRFNPAFEALTGLKEADVLKKSLKILFPPLLAGKSMALIQKTLSGERWETVEIEILHRDGSIRTVLWNSATLFAPDGKTPLATIAQGQDITRRKLAEKVLEAQHALLTSLINSPKDIIIFSLDKNYCYTAFNEKHREEMKRVWNADIEVGKNILDCMNITELRNLAKTSIDRALNGEVISEIQHQPEADIYYEFNWNPIWLNEQVDGVTVFIRDISERRKEEEKLKESLILLRIAEELAKIGGWSVTLVDNRVKWSSEVAAIHEAPAGYSPMLEEGMNFYAPEFRDKFEKVFTGCAEKGIPFNEELQIITMKGRRVWIQSIGEAVRDGNGHIYKIQGAFQDISERKKAEEELYALNSRQDALLSAVPDIIMEVDNSMKYTWANRAGKEFFGDDIIGKDASLYFEGEQETYDLVQPLFKGDENIVYIESWQRRYDGQKRLLAWWCRVLKDENGSVTGALSTARDITENKHAQDALQKSEERYRSLLTNLDAGIVVHSPDTSIIMNNRRASELLGLSEDQMKGRMAVDPGWKFVNENSVPLPLEEYPVNQVAATRTPFVNEILGVIRPRANDLVWLTVNGFPVFDAHGKLIEIIISFFDITERKKAEEALRLKNLVFDASLAANSIADINGIITEANDAFLRLWGFKDRNEVLCKPIMNFILNPSEAVAIVTAIDEHEEWEGDYTAKRKDGSTFIAHSVATTLKDLSGNRIGFQSSVIDITERKLSEEALRESEQKFRDTVTFLDEGYYSVTVDGVLLEHNQAFCRLLGFDKLSDLRGTPLPDFWLIPEERKDYLQQLLTNGSISNYQIKAKTKTGEIITVLLNSHLVTDAENQPFRIEGVFIDITERIRNEESLQRHTARLQNLHKIDQAILSPLETPEAIIQNSLQHIRSLLSSQHASIGILDFENDALKVFTANINGEFIELKGENKVEAACEELEILRQKRLEVIEHPSKMSATPELLNILRSEGIMACINVPLVSGEKLIGAMNLGWENPRAFTAEEIEIATEVATEVTIAIEQIRLRNETKRYAEEMEVRVRERTAQLEASNNELEAFSYSVSHDLRAPLRHISGFVDLLSKSLGITLPEKEKHYLETISDSAHQMGMLIDDLLQFSRTGRQEMLRAEMDMNVVLNDAMQLIHADTKGRNIKWTIIHLPIVYGDFALLRLVWFNLISNAVKFSSTTAGPQIEIGFTEETLEFIFFVRDNGVGFDMQYAHKLFGVFQRLHPSNEFEGTGIGLANVRRIILRHGGRTWAESELNKGAVFYFSIPKNREIKP